MDGLDAVSFEVAFENRSHCLGFVGVRDQLLFDDVVAKRRRASDPSPHLLQDTNLVAHPVAENLTLELREGEQNVQH
jgi:hypothetical protein